MISTSFCLAPLKKRTTFEELRADIVGLFDAQTAVRQGIITETLRKQIYATYIQRCLKVIAVRGFEQPHARGALVALNYFVGSGAIYVDPATGRTVIDIPCMTEAVRKFVYNLMFLKGNGDKAGVERLYVWLGSALPDGLTTLFKSVEGIPGEIIVKYAYDDEGAG